MVYLWNTIFRYMITTNRSTHNCGASEIIYCQNSALLICIRNKSKPISVFFFVQKIPKLKYKQK